MQSLVKNLASEWRYLLPAWFLCFLLPLLPMFFSHADEGAPWPYFCFFIACTGLVAYAFRRDIRLANKSERPKYEWIFRMGTITAVLLSACIIFSFFCFVLNIQHSLPGFFLTFLIIVPPICITPYFTLVTRNSLAGAIFTIFAVLCMKLLGCVVVVLVYGWHADIQGKTTMPWTHPNLLVWLFLFNTGALSVTFYFSGAKKFERLPLIANYASQT